MKYNKEQVDILQNAKTIEDYLLAVKPFSENHLVIICSNETPCGSPKFTSQLGELFCDTFDTDINLTDKTNHSYVAVIDNGSLAYENCTTELIDYSFSAKNAQFRVISSNAGLALTKRQWDDLEGAFGISIGGKNFSYPRRMKQERKVSILLYNNDNEIFSISFLDGYTCKLLQTFVSPLYMDSFNKHESLNVFFTSRKYDSYLSLYDETLARTPKQYSESRIAPTVKESAPFGRRIYALMTGSIRNQYDMFATLYLIFDYIERGIIEGLIWSTWSGEPEMIPGLREKLNSLGVMIVETQMPGSVSSNTAQLTQVRNALYVIPDDVWVIRIRTDFTLDCFMPIIHALCNTEDLNITSVNNIPSILNSKIICGVYISEFPFEGKGFTILDWAFYFPDLCFAATKNDMLMMTNIPSATPLFGGDLLTETCFFGSPFLLNIPLMIDYSYFLLQYSPRPVVAGAFRVPDLISAMYLNMDDEDNFTLPSFLEKVFSVIFPLYYSQFHFADVMKDFKDTDDKISFIDIFTEINDKSKRVPRHTIEYGHMKKLVLGQVHPSAGYAKFLNTYSRVASDWAYVRNLHLTPDDMKEATQILAERGFKPLQINPWLSKAGSFVGTDSSLYIKRSDYLFDYLDSKERKQLVSIYNEHLDYPDYKERIIQECEANDEILPKVFQVLMLNLIGSFDFLWTLSKYPNIYLRFFRLVVMNDCPGISKDALFLIRLTHYFVRITRENVLSPIHLAANYFMLSYLEKKYNAYPIHKRPPQYDMIGSEVVKIIREVTGVGEHECDDDVSSCKTIINIITRKISSDESWEHIDKFREFLKLIEQ